MSTDLLERAKGILVRRLMPPPVRTRHQVYSMCLSLDDEPHPPSPRLLDLAIAAIGRARVTDLRNLSPRAGAWPYLNVWPGEHYRLLAGLVTELRPSVIVELGTHLGWSAATMRKFQPADGRLVTFDIMDWSSDPLYALSDLPPGMGSISLRLADVTQPATFDQHRSLFEECDIILVDICEAANAYHRILALLDTVRFRRRPVLIVCGIRRMFLLPVWRAVTKPKLDMVSFAHWAGTGLVDLVPDGSPHPTA
ncbi:MAG: hypothetical protein HYY13_07675 [Nitrospirae bacterium]|nr:hypothetical protein [Nitrospirota bacterium]